RLIPILARQGKQEEGIYVLWAIQYLPLREKYQLLEKIIEELRELPDGVDRVVRYASEGYQYPPDTPDMRAFLTRLARSKDKQLQAAAEQLTKKLEGGRKAAPSRYSTDSASPAANAPGPEGIKRRSVALTIDPPTPSSELPPLFQGILVAGPKTDVVWSTNAVFLMKAKGRLRVVWRGP